MCQKINGLEKCVCVYVHSLPVLQVSWGEMFLTLLCVCVSEREGEREGESMCAH